MRLRYLLASAAAAVLLGGATAGWGQAMGKLMLDGSAAPAVPTADAEPGKSVGGVGSLRAAAGAPDLNARGHTELAANIGGGAAPTPSAAPVTPKVEPRVFAPVPEPAGPRTPASMPATPAATEPFAGPANTPAGGVTTPRVSIEKQPIGGGGTPAAGAGGAGGGETKSNLPSMGYGQVIAALAIVLGLIFIGRALVKKFVPGAKGGSGKGVIEILARHPLAKNQSLVLVRIGSQIVALNQGKDASQSVLVISDQMEVARIIGQIEGKNPASIQAGFNKLLANARMDLEEGPEEETDMNAMGGENLDEQLEEMAAAKRQLMELRQHVRSVRDRLPRE